MVKSKKPILFETAWEVCNQVGGIYTVIRTKVPAMQARHGDNYFLIGPYQPEKVAIEFEEAEAPELLRAVLPGLETLGIKARYGRWLIKGRPQVLLFDYQARFTLLDQLKYYLWKDHGLNTPPGDHDVNNAIAFGFAVADFFRLLAESKPDSPLVAQFHEWQTGIALLQVRHQALPISTVFTTHATILGRYMASDNPHFYSSLDYTNPYEQARNYNIESRYLIERFAAHAAHYFTTISEVTALEAEKLLGRRPDHILPNGLNIERFIALHEFQNLHLINKERIHDFVMGHFFPSYTFDLDRTIYIFTSGRYEYRNKGMDIFIEGLYRLNEKLKTLTNPPTVVAFIITRTPTRSVNVTALHEHAMFEDIKNICTDLQHSIARKVLVAASEGRLPEYEELLPNDFQVRLKRAMLVRKTKRQPLIVTHDLYDDAGDAVLRHLRHRQLFNAPTDPVKVVFHPDFLTATGPIINLDYDNFVRGCHLGVFPSYYEPWGYTPLECIALGIPAVTTDLTGFGNFAMHNIPNLSEQGLYILRRAGRSADACIEDLALLLMQFCELSRRERIEFRNRAERLSDLFDWSKLASYYHRVHEIAAQSVPPPAEVL